MFFKLNFCLLLGDVYIQEQRGLNARRPNEYYYDLVGTHKCVT